MERPDRIETLYDEDNDVAVFHCVDATRAEVLAEAAAVRETWERHGRWAQIVLEEGHTPHHMFDLTHTAVLRNHPNRSDFVEVRFDGVVLWVHDGYDKGKVGIRLRDAEDGT